MNDLQNLRRMQLLIRAMGVQMLILSKLHNGIDVESKEYKQLQTEGEAYSREIDRRELATIRFVDLLVAVQSDSPIVIDYSKLTQYVQHAQ